VHQATGYGAPCHMVLLSSVAGLRVVGHMASPEPPEAERWGSRAIEHVTVPKPSHLGSRNPELLDSWWRMDAHPAPGPNLELVHRGTRSAEYRQRHWTL
jgi:hypothetical protein